MKIQLQMFQDNLSEIYEDFQVILPYEQKINQKKKVSNLTSCDLMIVLDCTGSMQSWISACKQNILKIIQNVKQQFQGSELRVGIVAYRDHCDTQRIEMYPFINQDYENLEKFISSLKATGGGDEPEDLAGALETAINLFEWKSQAKTMIIITDAPCHGDTYHNSNDHYPQGCPNGIDIEEYIYIIGKKGIDLNVIDIQSQTNKMYEIFSKIYEDARGKPMIRLKLGQNTLQFGNQISQTVATTITSTTQKSVGDEVYQKAFRILRAQKGLLNTKCLSKTELELMQSSQSKTKLEQYSNKSNKQKQIIEEENEDSEKDEDEANSEEEKQSDDKQDDQDNQDHKIILEQKELQKLRKEWEMKKYQTDLHQTENPASQVILPEKNPKKQDYKNLNYIPSLMMDGMDWENGFNSKDSFTLSCTCLTPYVDKRQDVNWNDPQIKIQQLTSKIKVMKKYFAEGAMRYAFYAYDQVLNLKLVAKLHKEMKHNSNLELMKRDSMSLIACHYFAEEFNSRLLLKTEVDVNQNSILLNFVNSTIYEIIGHPNKEIKYYFVENLIEGDYQKYNNNAGWTNLTTSSDFNKITQAFSHFTWQYSHGQLLVVDIQGGENGILTDPQIHTKNRSKLYGQGDLGYEGMLRFFYTHECNLYCQKFNLIHPKTMGQIPPNFQFFDDLFGLEINEPKQEQSKEIKVEDTISISQQQQSKEEQNKQQNQDERKVSTQCSLCKKCFQSLRSTVIYNRKNKVEIFCDQCQLQCSISQIDLACTTCGKLFQISKYYCKVKKINLIGKCMSCRE
ncbi:mhck/ef2 kinase domain protein (macronuclear) [Tetrahymena thermophila SB210]|uniref:Mhck/ef2 kinase domain protein n=1 Tax=Tetrahymena thermophila (strain SB210) TaxID=312017 RepID=Q22UE9_TETTS|nr:mhck/ef2 kinase domain protein [Tetrahymena thermophila SB210]EAR88738.2 mhck/ef2 kinase domain protein [Tetrahymena thermophila SB210]|eukprot:XP_001008983.2 mhck/ef2 kinase domain protein [Tetrahymena thermophila SB210]